MGGFFLDFFSRVMKKKSGREKKQGGIEKKTHQQQGKKRNDHSVCRRVPRWIVDVQQLRQHARSGAAQHGSVPGRDSVSQLRRAGRRSPDAAAVLSRAGARLRGHEHEREEAVFAHGDRANGQGQPDATREDERTPIVCGEFVAAASAGVEPHELHSAHGFVVARGCVEEQRGGAVGVQGEFAGRRADKHKVVFPERFAQCVASGAVERVCCAEKERGNRKPDAAKWTSVGVGVFGAAELLKWIRTRK